ncbi:MAG: hypothetical protein KatS3mg027_2666 [Bacteroidia bacterium]|nr:MAG: hypothetical protein KatS3mg027_2666 [Bacteroidia bacterium]
MKRIVFLIATFIYLIKSNGQSIMKSQDSIRAYEILHKAQIKEPSNNESLNKILNLEKKEIIKIIKVVLYFTYGKKEIRKQTPFKMMKIDDYLIVWGQAKRKKGGVFEIVINTKNLCVEYLYHGK